jgi:hypothetical protein
MAYDLPTNISGNFSAVATYANTVTDNMFWNFVLIGVIIAGFSILMARGAAKEDSFAVVSFIGLILAGMMSMIGLIHSSWIFLFTIFLAVSGAMLWKRGDVQY